MVVRIVSVFGLLAGAAFAAFLTGCPGSVPGVATCGLGSCSGCCTALGACVPLERLSPLTCGSGGEVCQPCQAGTSCKAGACLAEQPCEQTCASGCCDTSGTCLDKSACQSSQCKAVAPVMVDDSGKWTGHTAALAVDAAGQAHIAYTRQADDQSPDALYIASGDGSGFKLGTIDAGPDVGTGVQITVDSKGALHLVYYDREHFNLKYAWGAPGTTFQTRTLDQTQFSGLFSAIAVDKNDVVHVAYNDSSGNKQKLRYAWGNATAFTFHTIEADGGGGQPSIAVASDGKVHISYTRTLDWPEEQPNPNEQVRYAVGSGATFTHQAIDTSNSSGYSALALDSQGKPHIIFYREQAVPSDRRCRTNGNATGCLNASILPKGLFYAAVDGVNVTLDVVDDEGFVGGSPNLVVGEGDTLFMTYDHYELRQTRFASGVTPPFDKVVVSAQGQRVFRNALARGPKGGLHIVYYDLDKDALFYTVRCP